MNKRQRKKWFKKLLADPEYRLELKRIIDAYTDSIMEPSPLWKWLNKVDKETHYIN